MSYNVLVVRIIKNPARGVILAGRKIGASKVMKTTIPFNRMLAIASITFFGACSGPFGIVIGPESTHNAYNRRVAIERQYVHGNQLTERDRQELNELLNEVK